MKLGEAIYKASQDDGGDDDGKPAGHSSGDDDDILDADFEDLGDNKRG